MKRAGSIVLICIMLILILCGCGDNLREENANSKKLSIISTIFPSYDFARQIAGDRAEVSILLTPGSEAHSFEPSAIDIVNIQSCDLFIYVGGESDAWVDEILKGAPNIKIIKMFDVVEKAEEEIIEGMDEDDVHSKGHTTHTAIDEDYDEHVWTSPENAVLISESIMKALCEIDSVNEYTYTENYRVYKEKLEDLDNSFKDFFGSLENKELIFADRFPFRYFADRYGLKYYAAFPGCSDKTEASLSTVAFLVNKVKQDNAKTIFYLENSNHVIADKIVSETGAKSAMLHSCHNVSKEDLLAGTTYIDLMNNNLETLKEAF